VALIVGALALLVSPISILGWIVGAAAIGLGVAAVRRPAAAKQAKIAMVLGGLAILVGVFFFTLNVALH
jgi:predicted transporter